MSEQEQTNGDKLEIELFWWSRGEWKARLCLNGRWVAIVWFDDLEMGDTSSPIVLYLRGECVAVLDSERLQSAEAFFEKLEVLNEV